MATPTQKFRKTLDNFIAQVLQWSNPEQKKEISKIQFKLDAVFKINAKGAVQLFVESITPYASYILNNDWDYFLNTHIDVDQEFNVLQEKIKSWWPTFTTEQQEQTGKNIKLLIMLGAIAVRSEELRGVINQFRDADNPLVFH